MGTITMKTIAVMIVAIGIVVSACKTDTENTVISGTVFDAASGLAIDSAIINLQDTTYAIVAYSDSSGSYTTVSEGYRTWRVYCRKAGYETAWQEVTSSDSRPRIAGVDFELEIIEE